MLQLQAKIKLKLLKDWSKDGTLYVQKEERAGGENR